MLVRAVLSLYCFPRETKAEIQLSLLFQDLFQGGQLGMKRKGGHNSRERIFNPKKNAEITDS